MIEIAVAKRCSRCKEVKACHLFTIDLTCKDGYKHQCKACKAEQDRALRAKRRASGLPARSSRKRKPPQTAWALPQQTLQEGLDCVRLRNWRGVVSPGQLRSVL